MAIYYIALLYILILGVLFYRHTSDRAKRAFLFLSFLGLFLLMALRSETVGRDVHLYRAAFTRIAFADNWSELFSAIDSAPVYCLLSKAVSFVGDYRLMLVVTAFIILYAVAVYIYHFSDNVVISTYCFVSLYFYLHAYNISRQFLAIALFLLALCFRKKKRMALCVLFFLLALGVHNLTFIAIPLLLLDREKITTKKFVIYMAASTVCVLLFAVGFSRIVGLFASLFTRYQIYMQGGKFSVYNRSSGAIIFLGIFYLLVAIMAVILQSNVLKGMRLEFEEQSRLRYLIIAVTTGALMGILCGGFEAVARVLYFYQIHVICLIPNAFGKLRQYRFYYPVYYALLLILLIPFTICLKRNFGEVVPYVPMWR